jgi:hypothetical protein
MGLEVSPIKFVNWDYRPAILVGDEAFAVLRPGTPWVSVDASDNGHTGAELSETAWRKTFVRDALSHGSSGNTMGGINTNPSTNSK